MTPPPVTQTDPPKISCPASQTVVSPLSQPVSVVYGTATVVGGKSPVTTTCTPPSGSMFGIGTTTVACSTIDAQQRSDSCTFTVNVTLPPRIGLTRFSAFGDSITWGEDGTNPASLQMGPSVLLPQIQLVNQEYPYVLEQELKGVYTAQFSQISVRNNGNPGEYAGMPTTVTRFMTTVVNSDGQVVLIMEGSNDLGGGESAEPAAISNLSRMISLAISAGIRPYLATIPPMNASGSACVPRCRGQSAALVPGFNDRIRNLAGSLGVPLVDVYVAFGGDLTLLSSDGLHPNANGYRRIADTFLLRLRDTMEVK